MIATPVPAVVLAGGRISGWFARASGTTIKALVPVRGKPLFRWVLDALAATSEVGEVCVVGPSALAAYLAPEEQLVPEVGRVLENLRAGLCVVEGLGVARVIPSSGVSEPDFTSTTNTAPPDSRTEEAAETSSALDVSAASSVRESRPSESSLRPLRLCGSIPKRVLVVGADSGSVTPDALSDLLSRVPAEAELCLPLVRKERFQAAFPGNLGIYVRLSDGAFTSGGQVLVDPAAIERNAALLQRMFDRRKSQLAMAQALGPRFLGRLIAGRLSVAELEERATELTGCVCRAVPDCDPLLAFDVDNVLDARYLESWLDRRQRAS